MKLELLHRPAALKLAASRLPPNATSSLEGCLHVCVQDCYLMRRSPFKAHEGAP